MVKSILDFFSGTTDVWQLLFRILLILCLSTIVFVLTVYARKRNIDWLIYIEVALVLILFGFSFADIPGFKIFIVVSIVLMGFADIAIFVPDFSRDLFRRSSKMKHLFSTRNKNLDRDDLRRTISCIVRACQNLSKVDTGALIIISDNIGTSVLESGTTINSTVTSELLETIFFPKTPLHDGAVVITADTIVAAACYLPLSQNLDLPKEFGSRHRAAIGITQDNPTATAIVVSEETGIISAMFDGRIKRYLDSEQLTKILEHAFGLLTELDAERVWGGKTNI